MSPREALQLIRNAMTTLYPTQQDAARVASDSGLDPTRIAFGTTALNIWHSIVDEAEKQRQVEALLEVALSDFPRYKPLLRAAETYRAQDEPAPTRSEAYQAYRTWLRRVLERRFAVGELVALCFDLGFDYDALQGNSKTERVVAIVDHLETHNAIPRLIDLGRKDRPDIDWQAPPP